MTGSPCPPCQHDPCACDESLALQGEMEGKPRLGADNGRIITGHVLDVLASLPEASVSCVVTSPPYWSLRKYDAADVVWGGDPDCPHTLEAAPMQGEGYTGTKRWNHGATRKENPDAWVTETRPLLTGGKSEKQSTNAGSYVADQHGNRVAECAECAECGAWRGQYGLEPTPELYVEHSLMVLRAIRRVLRDDGVCWWNIGDGYSGSNQGVMADGSQVGGTKQRTNSGSVSGLRGTHAPGLKPKDLILMPERVALAAQADGWWIRSRIIWVKPNAMPESVRDRPTNAHETIWMLTKSARYWWDQEAVREGFADERMGNPGAYARTPQEHKGANRDRQDLGFIANGGGWTRGAELGGRNVRDVWTFSTAQTPEAHFATFPPELPRRCIEASCPKEICAKCGTARMRIVEERIPVVRGESATAYEEGMAGNRISTYRQGNRERDGNDTRPAPQTVGWSDCACAEPDYQPGIVLDPFAGLATTGIVARRLGRRFIGIELSETYAAMARAKLAVWWQDTRIVEREAGDAQMELPL